MRPPIFSVTPMRSSGSRVGWKIFFVIFTKLIPRMNFICIAKILVLMVCGFEFSTWTIGIDFLFRLISFCLCSQTSRICRCDFSTREGYLVPCLAVTFPICAHSDLLFLLFLDFLVFLVCKEFLAFLSVFLSFPRIWGGSLWKKNPCFFSVVFLAFHQKKQVSQKTMTATDVTGFDAIFSTGFFATFSRV